MIVNINGVIVDCGVAGYYKVASEFGCGVFVC
jgi:hypothetical protein